MANRYSREDMETLDSWLMRPHTTDEYQQLLIQLDKRIKNIHDNGYIISHFHPTNIETDADDSTGSGRRLVFDDRTLIRFKTTNQNELLGFEEAKKQNIYSAAVIALNAYTSYNEWNLNFVRENFNNGISILFPEDVVGYYNIVLTRGSNIYLNQFIKAKNEKEIFSLQTEVKTESSNARGHSKRKSNGKSLLSEENNAMYTNMNEQVNTSAAFMRLYFFPVLILTILSILIPLIAVMIGLG